MAVTQKAVLISIERHLSLARLANALAVCCPQSQSAYSVGAIITDADGRILGAGYSRQSGPHDHAEEVALRAAKSSGRNLRGAYVYTSLEPCGIRNSKPRCCASLLVEAGIARVYFTAREPTLFQRQTGLGLLKAAGILCFELPGCDHHFRHANWHLLEEPHACELLA
jgi:pyrimidine deaminase RibD-like protein